MEPVKNTTFAPAAPAQSVPGGMSEGVWAVHLIGFSLSTCVVVVFICSLRLLLMRCTQHQEPSSQAGAGTSFCTFSYAMQCRACCSLPSLCSFSLQV